MNNNNNDFPMEGRFFLETLAQNLGEPHNQVNAKMILKTVLHSLRDSITVSEAMDFRLRLPEFLLPLFDDQWVKDANDEREYDISDIKDKVIEVQSKWENGVYGKSIPAGKMIKTVLDTLDPYTKNPNDSTVNTAILIAYSIE